MFQKWLKENNIDLVILKESSPTCGVNYIYDGTFTHTKIKGCGFLTKMLKIKHKNKLYVSYITPSASDFYFKNCSVGGNVRYCGRSVRPVCNQ